MPRQAGRGAALIVMGVARRTGEELFFGETATGLLQRCPCPVVLISDSGCAVMTRAGKSCGRERVELDLPLEGPLRGLRSGPRSGQKANCSAF
ncbi:universal stress protein [Mesorhizobium sp. LSJC264A00]|uniref:universal stress protein n=1 Tax=Mesorhizobium sp. LSJC264A00 TaxID=1287321 RepID=UPI001FDAB3B6|nr:universal stress protein [Mesorhizobium sp. LSJC264A00]